MANKNAIEAARKFSGFTQAEFAKFAGERTDTYRTHERELDLLRIGELQRIACRLSREHCLVLANAIVETIFGKGMEVNISK